ncbi:MAG: PAS domain-containing sensor histidine kinase [Nitrospirae bacterium]|nr:MAG: PAS domain-containing sensor histidine kinase [Nitrospirota bacterium]
MKNEEKTREDLIEELAEACRQASEFEKLKAEFKRVENVMRQAVIMAGEEKARTEAIIAAIGDGISVQDTNFRVLLQNQNHKDMVGDHIGEFCYKAFQGRDAVCEGCHLAESFIDGKVHVKEQTRTTDRGIIYYEIKSSPLTDATGKIIAGIEAVRDITQRKQIEMALYAAETKFRTLIEQSFVGIYIIQDNLLVYVNPRFSEIFGYAPGELVSKPAIDLVTEESREIVAENIRKRLSGEVKTVHYTFKGRRKDGAILDLEAQGTVAELNNCRVIIGTVIDITERRRLEREALKVEKLESLGMLAAGIAHEYNNVLTAITGNIQLAKMYAKPGSEIADILSEAEKGSQKAEKLTRQLIVFSKGGTLFKKIITAEELFEGLTALQDDSPIRCELSLQKDLWPVEVDEEQIRQALTNIIENARESMSSGGLITVEAENIEAAPAAIPSIREGRYLKLSVSDQGSGIAEPCIERIFEPFFTTKHKGVGLGLTTAFSIIQGHDGYITVESQAGTGTIFHIYIPAARAATQQNDRNRRIPVGRRNILVMDDDELVRHVVERMLNQCGCNAAFSNNGEEMLSKYAEALEVGHPFDVVIIDLIIASGMGGKHAIKKLLELDPHARAIVSSGYSEDLIMANYRDYGFKAALPKPYRIPRLSQVLHEVLTGAEA